MFQYNLLELKYLKYNDNVSDYMCHYNVLQKTQGHSRLWNDDTGFSINRKCCIVNKIQHTALKS